MSQFSSTTSDDTAGAESLAGLARFDAPPERFLVDLLATQCRLTGAAAGVVMRPRAGDEAMLLAAWPAAPTSGHAPLWMAHAAGAAGRVATTSQPALLRLAPDGGAGGPEPDRVALVPIRGEEGVRAVAAFLIVGEAADGLERIVARLEATGGLLDLYETRVALQRRVGDVGRLRDALGVVAACGAQDRFHASAMAFCNEVAARWSGERVSLGFLHGHEVRLSALSHTERIVRSMAIVQAIEQAQEECVDQDEEIVHPAPDEATAINRAARDLSLRHGPTCVLTLPLRRGEEPVGTVTIETPPDKPLDGAEAETLRLVCDLCAPRLVDLFERDRWLGARLAAGARRSLARLLGPEHTWAKAAGVAAAAALLFLAIAKTNDTVDAGFTLAAVERQVVPAPFDGYLKDVHARVGDQATAGSTALADLDTADLRLQLAAAKAERATRTTAASAAMRDGDTAQAQIAQAQADRAQATIDLLERQIAKAHLVAAIDGVVVSGDLEKRIGAPVRTGEPLFEIAPVEALRAELLVPESRIADVRVGQEGELAAAAYPGRRVKFVVERITPAAEVRDHHNVFSVRARLLDRPAWMRPGMEGDARITVGRASYLAVWGRPVVDWLRMRLWM